MLATRTEPENEAERHFLVRGGWGARTVLLARMDEQIALTHDPFRWREGRTLNIAHRYISQHFDELENCSVVDVEYIEGEKPSSSASEIFG